MNLPGRLRATTLGDVLGQLHRERASGVLELVEARGASAGRVHRVHFAAGLVSEVECQVGVARLGEILRAQGLLSEEGLAAVRRHGVLGRGRRVGEVLIASGLASARLVSAALRRQLRLRLDALSALADAELRFRVAVRAAATAVPLSPHEFLHGRPRARQRQRGASTPPRVTRDAARQVALGVLGLPADASTRDVQRAFRRLASEVHPDRHPRASAAERTRLLTRFTRLSAAYHQLVA